MTDGMRSDEIRHFMRHALATLAYRAGKAIAQTPMHYPEQCIAVGSRTPVQIVSHMADVLSWAEQLARDGGTYHASDVTTWQEEVKRFRSALISFDSFLESDTPLAIDSDRLYQGPVADALTHVGQLAMLRRLAGVPLPGENFTRAPIEVGKVAELFDWHFMNGTE